MVRKFSEERGVAMVTALLISMIVLTVGLTVVEISIHSTSTSSLDRKRIQAVDAAEAGIDAYFSALTTSTDAAVCLPMDADLPISPTAHYHVDIQLYSTWPPQDGSELACTSPLASIPAGARVTSKGTAVYTTSSISASRTMQSEVRLTPIYSGLGQAIFSESKLDILNQLTLNGYQANDGDVYTNGNFTLSNNTKIGGSVYAQGTASLSQGIVRQNVWANGAVSLSNGIEVFGNTTSSTSSISLSSNSTIDGNAKAATTITGGTIKGTKTGNSPSGPPPQLPFPEITYTAEDKKAWTDPPPDGAGYTEVAFSSCLLAKAFIDAMPVGNYVVRITPTCALNWGTNSTVNLKGNLAIITDGSVTTVNQTNWNAVGGPWTVYFIVPYRTGLNCTKPSPYDVKISNNTSFNNGNKVFVYSPCNVDFGNNNAGGVNGQIIGRTVTITNNMTLNYVPIRVPGFNLTGFDVQVSYLREIRNA